MPITLDGNGIIKNINFQHPSASATNLTLNADGSIGGAIPYSYRNLLINGSMNIAQRGSSAVTPAGATDTYRADRWFLQRKASGANYSMEVVADAPLSMPGLKYSTKITSTAAISPGATDLDILYQTIEMQNARVTNNQDMAFSFWVKSSLTGSFSIHLTNAVGDPNRREYQTTYTIISPNTWEKKIIIIPAKDWNKSGYADTSVGFYIGFTMACGSNRLNSSGWFDGGGEKGGVNGATNLCQTSGATWFVTGIQLEVGSIATPFEFKPIYQELRDCQRYYQLIDHLNLFAARTSTQIESSIMFNQWMRSAPVIDISSPTTAVYNIYDAYGGSFTQSSKNVTFAVNGATSKGAFIGLGNFSGLTQGRTYVTNAASSGAFGLSSEL